ncbi:MAG: hypothetical protein U9M92_03110 [Patescibacteria group bacterium]|nr:hypothetical protein [Patescibacteria group bacterium]
MEQIGFGEGPKFKTPTEELAFLRQQVAEKEKSLAESAPEGQRQEIAPEQMVAEQVSAYREFKPHEVLTPGHELKPHQVEEIVLELSPELHDDQMSELLTVLQEKGVRNALTVVEQMKNPHLEDDFHRFLIAYLRSGQTVSGLKEKAPLQQALRLVLYEIALPEPGDKDEGRPLRELLSAMEQFYAGILAPMDQTKPGEPNYLTLEIANPNQSGEFIFYAGVPEGLRTVFEKQVVAIFPHATLREAKNDYNVFNVSGISVGAEATLSENFIYPLKTYDQFDLDPLNIILNSFSKIDREGEGAAIQFLIGPGDKRKEKDYRRALTEIEQGKSVTEAMSGHDIAGAVIKGLDVILGGSKPKEPEQPEVPKQIDQVAAEHVRQKIAAPLTNCQIRVIASSPNRSGAEAILQDLEAAFAQFQSAQGNNLCFQPKDKKALKRLLHDFTFRLYHPRRALALNIRELTTVMHWPATAIGAATQLKQAKASTAAAPLDLPKEGVLLGLNKHQQLDTEVRVLPEDRLRHFYTIGQTGTGKSALLKNMIIQDIQNGDGVCMIDPHGQDIQDVLAAIPKERQEDLIYFDPGYTTRPMALNMLEYDPRFPEQKTFVVNELLSIFNKLFDMKVAGGPMFEQYFRNAVLLAIEHPDSGGTLLDVSRVLADKKSRESKLANCKNPVVVQFWREVAEKAGGESALANIVPYVTSKFDVFLANDIMRPIIAQARSSFDFREVMDGRKILLVNLAKGRLGDLNANLIGLILVGKILMAALSRADAPSASLNPFYLYIDEFQNVTTDSIATILSEARKYKLGLHIAHQFIAQLTDPIRDAVFGNVGSLAVFRVGSDDAEYLEKQLAPVFKAQDLINLDNFHAYLRLLAHGRPLKPFDIETIKPAIPDMESLDKLKKLSYSKFGRPQAEIEAEISARYQGVTGPGA